MSTNSTQPTRAFWFRRDLRLEDNHGLYRCLVAQEPTLLVFIFDTNILKSLKPEDQRVPFIWQQLELLQKELKKHQGSLLILHNDPTSAWKIILNNYPSIKSIHCNKDYEPYAIERDQSISLLCQSRQIQLCSWKDHVIFEGSEILSKKDSPYRVFTPFSKKWLEKIEMETLSRYPSECYLSWVTAPKSAPITLSTLGFSDSKLAYPKLELNPDVIRQYEYQRDIPSISGTSRLGPHLRFGTLSIRKAVQEAQTLSQTWLRELIWRDFFSSILQHYPETTQIEFNPKYRNIPWRGLNHPEGKKLYHAFTEAQTGFPLVDAGVLELKTTGFMHNRIRMLAANVFTKHFRLDWRLGERFFARYLLDFDLASNIGGWQWAAGCGADAAPYFRVFNPHTQKDKFDPDGAYCSHYLPHDYSVDPILSHKEARSSYLSWIKQYL